MVLLDERNTRWIPSHSRWSGVRSLRSRPAQVVAKVLARALRARGEQPFLRVEVRVQHRLRDAAGLRDVPVARRPAKLEAAYEQLRAEGLEVQRVAANVGDEADVDPRGRRPPRRLRPPRRAHEQRRASGSAPPIGELSTKQLDLQLATNLRAIPLFYREALPMLTAAGAEHRNALVVNTASIAGKQGQALAERLLGDEVRRRRLHRRR